MAPSLLWSRRAQSGYPRLRRARAAPSPNGPCQRSPLWVDRAGRGTASSWVMRAARKFRFSPVPVAMVEVLSSPRDGFTTGAPMSKLRSCVRPTLMTVLLRINYTSRRRLAFASSSRRTNRYGTGPRLSSMAWSAIALRYRIPFASSATKYLCKPRAACSSRDSKGFECSANAALTADVISYVVWKHLP